MSDEWLMALTAVLDEVNNRNQEKKDFNKWLIQKTGALPAETSVMRGIPATDAEGMAQVKSTGMPLFKSTPSRPIELYGKNFYIPGKDKNQLFRENLSQAKLNEYLQGSDIRKQKALLESLTSQQEIENIKNRNKRLKDFGGVDPLDIQDFITQMVKDKSSPYIKMLLSSVNTGNDPAKIALQIEELQNKFTTEATNRAIAYYYAQTNPEYKNTNSLQDFGQKISSYLGSSPLDISVPNTDVNADVSKTSNPLFKNGPTKRNILTNPEALGKTIRKEKELFPKRLENMGQFVRNIPESLKDSAEQFGNTSFSWLDSFLKGLTENKQQEVYNKIGEALLKGNETISKAKDLGNIFKNVPKEGMQYGADAITNWLDKWSSLLSKDPDFSNIIAKAFETKNKKIKEGKDRWYYHNLAIGKAKQALAKIPDINKFFIAKGNAADKQQTGKMMGKILEGYKNAPGLYNPNSPDFYDFRALTKKEKARSSILKLAYIIMKKTGIKDPAKIEKYLQEIFQEGLNSYTKKKGQPLFK